MVHQQSTRRMRMQVGGMLHGGIGGRANLGPLDQSWAESRHPTQGPCPLPMQPTWAPVPPCACPPWTPARCLGPPRGSACPAPRPWASAHGRHPPPTASHPCLAVARPPSCAAASAAPSSGTSSAAVHSRSIAHVQFGQRTCSRLNSAPPAGVQLASRWAVPRQRSTRAPLCTARQPWAVRPSKAALCSQAWRRAFQIFFHASSHCTG